MQLRTRRPSGSNHDYIGTEHISRVVKKRLGVAANVLKDLDIDLRKIPAGSRDILQTPGGRGVMGRLPHYPLPKMVIDYSVEEAPNLNHNYVRHRTHCSWACSGKQEGVAAQVLMNWG